MPGQLKNLPVKREQIEPLTLAKYWVKLNFFFEKMLILHTIIHLKSLHLIKMASGTHIRIGPKMLLVWPQDEPHLHSD